MRYVLVTGAAGFIGAALARALQKDGFTVVTVDNLTTGFESNIPPGVIFVKGNCQDKDIIKGLAKYKFEGIFHIAGQSSGEISFDDPIYDLESNASSTLLLLKLAITVGCTKFIYASTMSLYGYLGDHVVSEDEEKSPKSFYGVGKLASEHYLRLYAQYGINSFAMRLFTVYGPGQNMENLRQGMVSIFMAQAHTNGSIHIKGDLSRYRDFIYIDDVVSAFMLAFTSNLKGHHYFNVSTGKKTTVRELISNMTSLFPREIPLRIEGRTEGDILGIHGNNAKIKSVLRWEPRVELGAGLKKMLRLADKTIEPDSMYNYVDISGFGHSGKSVVVDLLRELDGFQVPDYFFEFDFVRIPGGLSDLRHNVHDNWSPVRSDAAIKRFRNVAYRMGLVSSYSNPLTKIKAYGTQYEKYFNNRFFDETEKYINSLVQSKSVKHDWPYLRIDASYLTLFFFKLFRRLSLERNWNFKYLSEYYFVSSEGFVEKTQRYLDSLFSAIVEGGDIHTIVLNNVFEPFNPQSSMELFPNAKCIVVDRDPRDIYASTMMPKGGFVPEFLKPSEHWRMKKGFLMVDELNSFINNQHLINKSINRAVDGNNVLRIHYEDVVLQYNNSLDVIFQFLDIGKEKHVRKKAFFDPDKSKLNVGLWKQLGDQKAIRKIEDSLSEYCYHQ